MKEKDQRDFGALEKAGADEVWPSIGHDVFR